MVLFTQAKAGLADNPAVKAGWKVISVPDIRWGRRDIKTVQLLYPSMGKMMAKKAGVDDAWFTEDGFVTEHIEQRLSSRATASSRGRCERHPARITRAAVLRFTREAQMEVEERNSSTRRTGGQAFITSARPS